MKIFLIRHVETVGNVEKRFNGVSESAYTKRGEAMQEILLQTLVKWHQKEHFDAIYTSPTLRALKTAKKLSQLTQLPLTQDERLREFNFGIFEGLTAEEAEQKAPSVWKNWMKDYDQFTIPGGDHNQDYQQGIAEFIETLPQDKTSVIVTHGGTLRTMMMQLLDLKEDQKWHFDIALGSIVYIEKIENYGILKTLFTPEYP